MFFGLPLHPLVVHAAVIFVPVAALGALLVVFFAPVRTRYAGLVVLLGVAGAASAFAAMLTGPLLAEALGMTGSPSIARHQTLGTWTPWAALLQAVALPLFLRARRAEDRTAARTGDADPARTGDAGTPSRSGLARLIGGVTVVAALAALVLVGLTGHAGAESVWG